MKRDLVILYVEDEESTRNNSFELLSLMFDKVYAAKDGQEGFDLYKKVSPDIIISDIEMPYLNGLELASEIRKENKTVQIILTTAYTDTRFLLKAIELNLVKYLVKPVIISELEKALDSAYENIKALIKSEIYITSDTIFDFKNRELKTSNKIIELTYQELILLELLLKSANHSVPYETIESVVWDYEDHIMTDTALRSLVKKLRKKLPDDTIVNSAKLGYKIVTLES